MRKLCLILLLCLLAGLAASAETPRPILCSVYEQEGWGDRVTISFVDEKGGLWTGEGSASRMDWTGDLEDKALRMPQLDDLNNVGELSHDDLFAVKSLVASVEDQGRKLSAGMMLDYGIVFDYAIRYSRDGEPECVLLNANGDSVFANSDANAQGLRLWLVRAFAQGGNLDQDQVLAALGIVPTSMPAFCGYDATAIPTAEVTAMLMDCEAGPIPVELSEKEINRFRELATKGRVLCKANAMETTGNIHSILFRDAEGNTITVLEFYEGLLVRSDGMYYIDVAN